MISWFSICPKFINSQLCLPHSPYVGMSWVQPWKFFCLKRKFKVCSKNEWSTLNPTRKNILTLILVLHSQLWLHGYALFPDTGGFLWDYHRPVGTTRAFWGVVQPVCFRAMMSKSARLLCVQEGAFRKQPWDPHLAYLFVHIVLQSLFLLNRD